MQRCLIITGGKSPQVVTQTVWALARRVPQFVPDRIVICATANVAAVYRKQVLGRRGKLAALCRELKLPELWRDARVEGPKDENGKPLEDVRSVRDGALFGRFIARLVRMETASSDSVHVSLSGGRKTVSYYAGAAISLYGRAVDQLSHVLVWPEYFGECEGFWWPTLRSHQVRHPDGTKYDAKDARSELHVVPFFPMRALLPKKLLTRDLDLESAYREAQAMLDPPRLILLASQSAVRIEGVAECALPPREYAVLQLMAEWAMARHPCMINSAIVPGLDGLMHYSMLRAPKFYCLTAPGTPDPVRRFIEIAKDVRGDVPLDAETMATLLADERNNVRDEVAKYFRERLSRLKSILANKVDSVELTERFGGKPVRDTRRGLFGLDLSPARITIERR